MTGCTAFFSSRRAIRLACLDIAAFSQAADWLQLFINIFESSTAVYETSCRPSLLVSPRGPASIAHSFTDQAPRRRELAHADTDA